MFKAKLITDDRYYERHRRQLWITIIAAVPIGFAVNYYKFPDWMSVSVLLAFGAIFYFNLQNRKKLLKAISSTYILFTEKTIQVLANDPAKPPRSFSLREINKITLPSNLKIPDKSIRDTTNTLSGQQRKQYVIIEMGKDTIRYNFLLESYYMLTQFEKLIKYWENSGLEIHRL